jgi:hypothetical protein
MTISLSRERLAELLERARGKRIVVIGDAMLDVYLTGDVERISPEAPVPVVRVRDRKHALGGAANVAQNILAIGCECTLVAAIGSDSGGETIRGMLTRQGTNLSARQCGACLRMRGPDRVEHSAQPNDRHATITKSGRTTFQFRDLGKVTRVVGNEKVGATLDGSLQYDVVTRIQREQRL